MQARLRRCDVARLIAMSAQRRHDFLLGASGLELRILRATARIEELFFERGDATAAFAVTV
jgi:hypothetical protein